MAGLDRDKWNIIQRKLSLFWKNVIRSRYFYANILYVIYSTGMIIIDWADFKVNTDNNLYIIFGFFHMFNAAMYLWMWAEERNVFTLFCLPDWLNTLGAVLYLWSAFLYEGEYKTDDYYAPRTNEFTEVRYLELVASIVEIFAAVGWVLQWHTECSKKSIAGRGFTLDDPDIWANVTIVTGAVYYFLYNLQLFQQNFDNYDTDYMYYTGDYWYFVNSLIYLFGCSFRDCGLYFFLPTAGIWPQYVSRGRGGAGGEDGDGDDGVVVGVGVTTRYGASSSSSYYMYSGPGGDNSSACRTEAVPNDKQQDNSVEESLLIYGTFQNAPDAPGGGVGAGTGSGRGNK